LNNKEGAVFLCPRYEQRTKERVLKNTVSIVWDFEKIFDLPKEEG
jgi:hypothetical protein